MHVQVDHPVLVLKIEKTVRIIRLPNGLHTVDVVVGDKLTANYGTGDRLWAQAQANAIVNNECPRCSRRSRRRKSA